MESDNLVFITVKTKLKAVFQKQFNDFYGVYRESNDADALFNNIDHIFDQLDEELFRFVQSEEVSLESCVDAMASIFIQAFLLCLESERYEEKPKKKKR